MGEDAGEADQNSDGGKLPRHLSHISWNDRSEALAGRHGLPCVGSVEDLLGELDGLVIRDQGLPSGVAAAPQRRAVAKAARKIKSEAQTIMRAAENLRSALSEFASAVSVRREDGLRQWSANMLHQVFDIPPIDPTALDLPPELAALGAVVIPEQQWSARLSVVHDLAGLPVRRKIRPGPVPDAVLVRAVLACRSFWEGHGRAWGRGELAEATFRGDGPGARLEDLNAPAVKFLVDALTASDMRFTSAQLNSAWVDADEALGAKSPA